MLQFFEDIDAPLKDFSGKRIEKSVYLLAFEEGTHFRDKVSRICDSFQGKRFHLPNDGHGDSRAFNKKIESIDKKIRDTQSMLRLTKQQMHQYLEGINSFQGVAFSLYEVYRLFLKKEKAIYETLNMLQREGNFYMGFFWSNLPRHTLLNEVHVASSNSSE